MRLIETLVQPTEEAERIQKRLRELNYPLTILDADFEGLIDYSDDVVEMEHMFQTLRDAGRREDADALACAEDEDAEIWVKVCGDVSNRHVYARCWRLRRALSLLKE